MLFDCPYYKKRFNTLQTAFISCTIFQSLLRSAASCNSTVLFFRYCLPYCCFFPSKAELCMLYTMFLRSMISSMINTHHIHRPADIVRLTPSLAAYLAALIIPSQLLLFQAKRYGLTPLHYVPNNPLSPLRAARLDFSKKLHKTTRV